MIIKHVNQRCKLSKKTNLVCESIIFVGNMKDLYRAYIHCWDQGLFSDCCDPEMCLEISIIEVILKPNWREYSEKGRIERNLWSKYGFV